MFEEYGYLADTHTAVALAVYEDYVAATGDSIPVVIASTASPYKFAKSVYSAIGGEVTNDEFKVLNDLSEETKTEIPAPIKALETATVRFNNVCESEQMPKVVLEYLGL